MDREMAAASSSTMGLSANTTMSLVNIKRQQNLKQNIKADLIKYFSQDYKDTEKIVQTLYNNLPENDNYEVRALEYALTFDTENLLIPITIPNQRPQVFLSPTGYAILIYALYIKYSNKDAIFHVDVQCNLTKCPFYRICIDADVDDSHESTLEEIAKLHEEYTFDEFNAMTENEKFEKAVRNRTDGYVKHIKMQLAYFNCDKYTMTRRYNRDNNSFHIMTDRQFDMITATNIIKHIACIQNNIGIHIDVTTNWSLPGGRSHEIFNDAYKISTNRSMTLDEFKAISIVDVWNRTNFCCFLEGLSLESTIMAMTKNTGIGTVAYDNQEEPREHLLATKKYGTTFDNFIFNFSRDVNCDFFFKKFAQFSKFEFKRDAYIINIEFTVEALFKFITHVAMESYSDRLDHVDGMDSDEFEFYNIFDKTKITMNENTSRADLFKNVLDEIKVDNFANIEEQMLDVNSDEIVLKSAYEEYSEFIRTDIHPQLSEADRKCMDLLELHSSRFKNINGCIKKTISSMRRREDGLPEMSIYMYHIYCIKNNIQPVTNRNFFNMFIEHFVKALQIPSINDEEMIKIFPDYEPIPEIGLSITTATYDPNIFYSRNIDIIVKIFRHIFTIMLEAGNISSILSLIINSNHFVQNPLICSITALFSIGELTNRAKYLLSSYVHGVCELHTKTVAKNLCNCFERIDILHFLAEGFDSSAYTMRNYWYDVIKPFYNDIEEIGTGARRAKKKKVEFQLDRQNKFVKLFNLYIIFLTQNINLFIIYENNAYSIIELISLTKEGGFTLYNIIYSDYATEMRDEPNTGAFWYRRTGGIFNSLSGSTEHHTPSLFSLVSLSTPYELQNIKYDVYRNFDYDLKNLFLDTFLKVKHFMDYINFNKTHVILKYSVLPIEANSESSIQIVFYDLNDIGLKIPSELSEQFQLKQTGNNENIHRRRLITILNELYAIVCYLSTHGRINLNSPGSFISEIFSEEYTNFLGLCKDPSEMQNYINNIVTDVLIDSNISSTIGIKESEFLLNLRKSVVKSEKEIEAKNQAINNLKDDEDLLKLFTDKTFLNDLRRDPCNNMIIREAFNSYTDPRDYCDFKTIPKDEFRFIIFIMSWFLRMGNQHSLNDLNFFRFMKEDEQSRKALFNEFSNILLETLGPLIENKDLKQMSKYLEVYCDNTTLTLNPEISNIKMPTGYVLNNRSYDGPFRRDVFYSMASFIVQSQFCTDTFLDITKMCTSFVHRGNVSRLCYVFLGTGSSGKNIWIGSLIEIFKSKYTQQFSNQDLNTCEQTTGNLLTRHLNGNLLTWFDEVLSFGHEFKAIVNLGKLSDRDFFKKGKFSLQINSHVIMSANSEPKINDSAALLRLKVFSRDFQFVDYERRICINRKDGIGDQQLTYINATLGVQMVLKKYPRGGEINLDLTGNYLFLFNCYDIFFNSFSTPISTKFSKTQNARNKTFTIAAHPGEYLLENNCFALDTKNPMDIETFDRIASEKIKTVSSMFNSSIPTAIALKEFKDKLKQYIPKDSNKIELRLVN